MFPRSHGNISFLLILGSLSLLVAPKILFFFFFFAPKKKKRKEKKRKERRGMEKVIPHVKNQRRASQQKETRVRYGPLQFSDLQYVATSFRDLGFADLDCSRFLCCLLFMSLVSSLACLLEHHIFLNPASLQIKTLHAVIVDCIVFSWIFETVAIPEAVLSVVFLAYVML
jgi:hypothetical protein